MLFETRLLLYHYRDNENDSDRNRRKLSFLRKNMVEEWTECGALLPIPYLRGIFFFLDHFLFLITGSELKEWKCCFSTC